MGKSPADGCHWDLHHGNGTQHLFEDDPEVLYVSTHQYPFYPGTGAAADVGRGAGAGRTVNLPFPDNELTPEAHARLFAADLPRVAALIESSGIKASEAK